MKKVIINGDDFGITKACSYAIIDCFKCGMLRSASMMTNMPDAAHAARLMKENPDLSVGIHLNLTVGKPLTHVPSLIREDGTFNKKILQDASGVNLDELKRELEAQTEKFIELTGKVPDHFNSHHGIEMIPGAAGIQIELANKYKRPIRHFLCEPENCDIQSDFETAIPVFVLKKDWSKPVLVKEIIEIMESLNLQDGDIVEIGGHPGYVDADLLEISSLSTGRCYDARNFQSPVLRQYLEDGGFELADYRDLKKRNL